MISYRPLPEDRIHVGTPAFVRSRLLDSSDLETYWTVIVVNAVHADKIDVSPVGSSYVAAGLTESLTLRRVDDHFPLYEMIVS